MPNEGIFPSMNARLAALDFITGCLSVRPSSDAHVSLRRVIASGDLNWDAVLEIASAQRVTPTLWVSLKNRELVDCVPSQVREYLWKIHLQCMLRNQRLRAQVISITRILNSINVEPVLLKGGVSLFVRTFDDPGSRFMVDLDILVPAERAEHCWSILSSQGYIPIDLDFDYSRHHHLRPLRSPDDGSTIEIHRESLSSSIGPMIPTAFFWKHAERIQESGVTFNVPDSTARTLHNVLHSALVNRAYLRGDLSLRSLHELALMQRLYGIDIDWKCIRQWMDGAGKENVLNAWLYHAHRLFGSPLPEDTHPWPGAIMHFARTRLQARWRWLDEVVEKGIWFSNRDICERYKCDNDFASLTGGRMRLAASLTWKCGSQAFRWARRSARNQSP